MEPAVLQAAKEWTRALPAVSAFVHGLVRDVNLRDDVLQETAVAVLETHARFDPSQPFVAWAIGIARNKVRERLRRISREPLTFRAEVIDALAVSFRDDADERRLEWLSECLGGLERRARELCRLRYELDLRPAAIAERLGMSANAVSKALERVRDSLRECIHRRASLVEADR
jgi:RNA polymerase sigma-70 factor (ECF subfamily)